jgi:hypothetical protein
MCTQSRVVHAIRSTETTPWPLTTYQPTSHRLMPDPSLAKAQGRNRFSLCNSCSTEAQNPVPGQLGPGPLRVVPHHPMLIPLDQGDRFLLELELGRITWSWMSRNPRWGSRKYIYTYQLSVGSSTPLGIIITCVLNASSNQNLPYYHQS